MPKGWLKDLDLIQIKAALWQGDSPLSISRQFLITQSTVSAIKHGRLHPETVWPDGDTGPLPEYRATELHRTQRLGMLKRSEAATKRGHIKTPALRFPEPIEATTEEERWKRLIRMSSPHYTEAEIEQGWLDHVKEDEDAQRRRDQQRAKADSRVQEDEPDNRTTEEREEDERAWEADKRRRYALSHLWGPKGVLILENLVAAELSDEAIYELIQADTRAHTVSDQLIEFVRIRRENADGAGEEGNG